MCLRVLFILLPILCSMASSSSMHTWWLLQDTCALAALPLLNTCAVVAVQRHRAGTVPGVGMAFLLGALIGFSC